MICLNLMLQVMVGMHLFPVGARSIAGTPCSVSLWHAERGSALALVHLVHDPERRAVAFESKKSKATSAHSSASMPLTRLLTQPSVNLFLQPCHSSAPQLDLLWKCRVERS